ncbi:MAG: hypothetical protein ACLPZR_17965, partial [Solirubrobacteraceae bacterium]
MRATTLPFSIDPVLTRFQMPEWWRNEKGETKRNYKRLGERCVRGTTIRLPAGPLVQTVPTDDDWRTLAQNVIEFQRSRLDMPTQLDLLAEDQPRQLRPVRLNAPALVAFSSAEDRVNRLMAEASAEAADLPLAVPVIVPLERLSEPRELEQLLASVTGDGVSSYSLWTPGLTEERLLSDRNLFAAVLRLVNGLAERNIPVGHLHASTTLPCRDGCVTKLPWRSEIGASAACVKPSRPVRRLMFEDQSASDRRRSLISPSGAAPMGGRQDDRLRGHLGFGRSQLRAWPWSLPERPLATRT